MLIVSNICIVKVKILGDIQLFLSQDDLNII